MHARQIGPLNLGAKPYVRKKSQIIFVGAGYRVLLAATDSNQVPAGDVLRYELSSQQIQMDQVSQQRLREVCLSDTRSFHAMLHCSAASSSEAEECDRELLAEQDCIHIILPRRCCSSLSWNHT
jgi:hypothetical protein